MKNKYLVLNLIVMEKCSVYHLLLHETNKNRIQFWRNGGGVRFWPFYMTTVWPKLFINPKIDKKYLAKDYIKNNFGLETNDKLFDSWYASIVDFD